jgi:sulfhydrogenase subunit beta (sulfur reductase)
MSFIGLLPRTRFDSLIDTLTSMGAQCLGPTVRDGAIVYAPIHSSSAFPQGIHDQQSPGSYKLTNNNGIRWFAWANGPQALKPLLFAPEDKLWQVKRDDTGRLDFESCVPTPQWTAIIGVRACDLAALALQNKHFLAGSEPDQAYAIRHQHLIVIAVNCTHPAATCFCHATGDGPTASEHYDILLDELEEGFAVKIGSVKGKEIIENLSLQSLTDSHLAAIENAHNTARQQLTRGLPATDIPDLLFNQQESRRWRSIGEKCLSCGNCTAVCPTCFCHQTFEHTALDGTQSMRLRQWDSCFSQGHSYIHGITLRQGTHLRYRQWLTHKFASWVQQYNRSGCVGCGRCITWCPVGIDVTEELQRLAEDAGHA